MVLIDTVAAIGARFSAVGGFVGGGTDLKDLSRLKRSMLLGAFVVVVLLLTVDVVTVILQVSLVWPVCDSFLDKFEAKLKLNSFEKETFGCDTVDCKWANVLEHVEERVVAIKQKKKVND